MKTRWFASLLLLLAACALSVAQESKPHDRYKLLATQRTSTMEKELNEAAAQGYRILVGSPTSGNEMTIFLERADSTAEPYRYKLLATARTSTMEKELNEAAEGGYRLLPRTMMAKGQPPAGAEIVVVLERPPAAEKRYEYKLLATNRTSTLQKEVIEAQAAGFAIVGMVSRVEHMVILERESPK
jgi:hypothetical protein